MVIILIQHFQITQNSVRVRLEALADENIATSAKYRNKSIVQRDEAVKLQMLSFLHIYETSMNVGNGYPTDNVILDHLDKMLTIFKSTDYNQL